ncbi:hypothetical protein COY87_05035 [Candidatus Roizmanbacteria bacterium CG_4_10_14_0_8_um_filter_33_9]|uniref:Uncharacterized protein n=1 Tax=Candidatus Roizmanbacteria bacterium CG_4_10_14_0_8_um_filter_33_9 TaxID=1974826 RepID=A0A2M7QI43_9BACT|nr:MAG: hypothetical protein COY87_05035 [Candidatus Roizmanbacteria bacterium CG_4_10_14_0_8_um_filter_33_9]
MGYYLGKTEVRPSSQENTEYVKLFNLYVWNVKDPNQQERRQSGYTDSIRPYPAWLSLAYWSVGHNYQFY